MGSQFHQHMGTCDFGSQYGSILCVSGEYWEIFHHVASSFEFDRLTNRYRRRDATWAFRKFAHWISLSYVSRSNPSTQGQSNLDSRKADWGHRLFYRHYGWIE